MKPEEIKTLIKIVEESGIEELEVSRWWKKVRIRKNGSINSVQLVTSKQHNIEQEIVVSDAVTNAAAPVKQEEKPVVAEGHEIKSPMVGTFYRAPAPGEKPFAEVGDTVKKGQVLCIIEAMKLMNEIESEVDGEIKDILIDNAQPVEFNQTLFIIKE
ncbi:acetyl-CoA carboxylase biotin carboxyl carrier protein [candidate division KSB1 bacterium]